LPLFPNGKIDRAALPQPDCAQIAQDEYVAPTPPAAIALTKIFEEVLRMGPVGATSDLLKMGADSIQIFQITARANRAGIKISASQPRDGQSAAANGLPTMGQFQRNRRTGSKTALH